jgi:hypothetical protein
VRSKNRNRKEKLTNAYHISNLQKDSDNIYQKAVQEYEEFKRVSKNNLHESKEGSDVDGFGKNSEMSAYGTKIKAGNGKQFNNVGRSVLTYKKLVGNVKSPYVNGVIIENLNRAYLPSKLKKSRKLDKRKKKSSTPNVKARKYVKEYAPVLGNNNGVIDPREQAELNKLIMMRKKEEMEIMKRQKENIERLKQLQKVPNNQENLSKI